MENLQKINNAIKNVIDCWNKLDFTKLSRIESRGNSIKFLVLTYDARAYDFVRDVNFLLKNKHPFGDLLFCGHDNLAEEISSTNFKNYKTIIFNDTKMEEDEYIDKLVIFYENLLVVLEKYRKGLK